MQISDDEINILVTTFFFNPGQECRRARMSLSGPRDRKWTFLPRVKKKRRQKLQKCDDFAGIYQDRA